MQYLLNHFALDKVPMVGASGGALAAVLAACQAEPEQVMESAYKLSLEHKIWDKPLGLLGCWGQIIEVSFDGGWRSGVAWVVIAMLRQQSAICSCPAASISSSSSPDSTKACKYC